jgi:hypothetical protein
MRLALNVKGQLVLYQTQEQYRKSLAQISMLSLNHGDVNTG